MMMMNSPVETSAFGASDFPQPCEEPPVREHSAFAISGIALPQKLSIKRKARALAQSHSVSVRQGTSSSVEGTPISHVGSSAQQQVQQPPKKARMDSSEERSLGASTTGTTGAGPGMVTGTTTAAAPTSTEAASRMLLPHAGNEGLRRMEEVQRNWMKPPSPGGDVKEAAPRQARGEEEKDEQDLIRLASYLNALKEKVLENKIPSLQSLSAPQTASSPAVPQQQGAEKTELPARGVRRREHQTSTPPASSPVLQTQPTSAGSSEAARIMNFSNVHLQPRPIPNGEGSVCSSPSSQPAAPAQSSNCNNGSGGKVFCLTLDKLPEYFFDTATFPVKELVVAKSKEALQQLASSVHFALAYCVSAEETGADKEVSVEVEHRKLGFNDVLSFGASFYEKLPQNKVFSIRVQAVSLGTGKVLIEAMSSSITLLHDGLNDVPPQITLDVCFFPQKVVTVHMKNCKSKATISKRHKKGLLRNGSSWCRSPTACEAKGQCSCQAYPQRSIKKGIRKLKWYLDRMPSVSPEVLKAADSLYSKFSDTADEQIRKLPDYNSFLSERVRRLELFMTIKEYAESGNATFDVSVTFANIWALMSQLRPRSQKSSEMSPPTAPATQVQLQGGPPAVTQQHQPSSAQMPAASIGGGSISAPQGQAADAGA